MPRPSNPRKPEKLMQLRPVPLDNPALAAQLVPFFTEPKGIDRYNTSARVDPQHAVKIRNLMFDDGNLVSRLGTDIMGSEAASTVMQVVDLVRKGQKKVTLRFCLRHLEIFEYGLGTWRSFPVPLTGSERDFFAYTGWANKILFSNGVDGLWEFDFTTMAAKVVPGAPGAKHLTTFGNRVVASSTIEEGADYPLRVRWSAKDIYNAWSEGTEDDPVEAALAGGHEDLFGSPGGITDEAMGVFPFGDEQAWLIRSHSTWQMAVSGNALAPFRFNRVIPQVGTAYRNTIVSVDAGVVFASRDNVHYVTQQGHSLIGNLIADEVEEEVENLRPAYAAYDVGRQEYRIAAGTLVWRYRFVEQGWTADEYPWNIRALNRQIQGVAGLPIDSLPGIIDELSAAFPPGAINDLVMDRSFDNAMMFVPESTNLTMRENDQQQDMLVTGEETDSEILIETGFVKLDVLKAVEIHGIHGEYESEMNQQLLLEASFSDGESWEPYSVKDIEETLGSEMFFAKAERVSRKLRLRLRAITLGKLRLLGIAPVLVTVERTMASKQPKPASISILPNTLSLVVGGTQQLSWQVLDPAGQPISGMAVRFMSSNSSIATVSSSGLVRAIAAGSFAIVASLRNIQTQVPGTVTPAQQAAVASVIVTPDISVGAVGTQQQFTATVRDIANNILIGRTVIWSSSAPDFATITALGLASLIAEGASIISATVEGVTGAATLTVVSAAAAVDTVEVFPTSFSGETGDTIQLTATAKDIDGNVLSGLVVDWVSSAPSVATVNAQGLVTMLAAGSVTITATISLISATSLGTVIAAPVPVAVVTVTPTSFSVFPGSTQQLTVVTKDPLGGVLTDRVITYVSSNTAVATVNSTGLVTGVAIGNAVITVASEGKTAQSSVTVVQVPVASVTVSPTSFSVSAGSTFALTATPRDSSGNPLTGRTVTWGSSDVTKASVSSTGVVTAIAAGSVTITATSETKFGTSVGTVTSVTVTPSPLDSPSTTVYVPQPAVWALPQVFLDSRYNRGGLALVWASDVTLTDTGDAVTNTTNLQAEIDAAAARVGNSRIKLPNGWICNRIRLRKHSAGIFWTYIDAVTVPSPEGVRPLVAAMASAPQIRSTTASETGAVWCDLGADYTRFTGIRFLATTGSPCYRLLYFQGTPDYSTENADTSAATLPQWMVVDRCWVDGGNVDRVLNGMTVNTREFACVDSVIDGIYVVGQENHGINGYNALGPWKIVGNIIEAGSISVLLGGSDPRIAGLQTSDIEVRRNHMYKRPTWNLRDASVWDGISKVVKNIFELKWGNRVLIEGNVFENSFYGDNQVGAAIVFKVENSLGGNTTVLTENVTYRFNRAKNVAGGYEFQGVGVSAGPVGAPLRKVQVRNNVVEGLAPDLYVFPGGTTRAMFLNNGATDIIVDHDTICLHQSLVTNGFRQPILFAGVVDEVRLSIDNSLLLIPIASPPNASNSRVIFGDGSQVVSPDTATNTLTQYAPGFSFLNNVLVKSVGVLTSSFPATSRYTDTIASVGCISPATGNFALSSTSPYKGICADGSDPGANVALVNTATNGVAIVLTPPAPPCGLITSSAIIPVSAFPKPAYLVPAVDPDLGTRIIRITGDPGQPVTGIGGTWGNTTTHHYAKDPFWSKLGTYAALTKGNFGDYMIIDGNSYVPYKYISTLGEARWDPVNDTKMVYVASNGNVGRQDVVSGASSIIVAAGGGGYNSARFGPNEGNLSWDGRYLVVQAIRNSDSHSVCWVVDMLGPGTRTTTDFDLTAAGLTSLDWVSVSAGGGYVVIFTNDRFTRVYTRSSFGSGSTPIQTWTDSIFGHDDLGIDPSANEVAFGSVGGTPFPKQFISRRLDTGAVVQVTGQTTFNCHASCRNSARSGYGYGVVNTAEGRYLDGTIFAAKLDGTVIERLCRHRSTAASYNAEPHAVVSYDGKRVAFASDWGGTVISTYICDVRNICP